MNKIEYIEQYIRNIAKNNPDIFTEDLIQLAINKFENDTDDISVIQRKIDEMSSRFVQRKQEEQIYLEQMQQKFNNSEYTSTSILNLDISNLNYEQMEQLFFHYSWKNYLESYDKNGMKPVIGENSEGIDPEASIFFSKGVEGVLELWDVWLKWRLNRQNNPQFEGTTQEEIQSTNSRFRNGQITEEERRKWFYWIDYFKNKKYLENTPMLENLFNYQFTEMINSDYLILDLKENEDFSYDQVDIKKQRAIEKAKETRKGIDPLTSIQYGYYSDFSSPVVDKWNMQTIPGKNITIEPSRMRRLSIDGKTDVFSIMKYMYDMYKKEVPKDEQVKFDILDSYVKYVCEKKLNKNTNLQQQKENAQGIETEVSTATKLMNKENPNKETNSQMPNSKPISVKKGSEFKSASFTRRSELEIQTANQIKEKNSTIQKQNEQQRNLNKPKVKKLTKTPNNGANNGGGSSSGGFVDILTLTLIIGFIAGVLFMIAYSLIK